MVLSAKGGGLLQHYKAKPDDETLGNQAIRCFPALYSGIATILSDKIRTIARNSSDSKHCHFFASPYRRTPDLNQLRTRNDAPSRRAALACV